jgi:DNA-binding CsgD family transcriptional regulator
VIARAGLALAEGDATSALAILDPMVDEMRTLGLPYFLSGALALHGIARLAAGEPTTAAAELLEARDAATQIDNRWLIALIDHHLGSLARRSGEPKRAQDLLHHALAVRAANKWLPAVADTLAELAGIAADHESCLEATRLLAAASAIRNRTGCKPSHTQRLTDDSLLARARAELDDAEFAGAWGEGENLSADDAVAYASRARGERKRPTGGWESLTPTELRVVELAREGLTNAAIAQRMFVSPATVKVHLAHIYAKVDVPNRAALATAAAAREPTPESTTT